MNNILRDLYHGRFSAWERRPALTTENIAVNRKIEDEKRYFIQKMSLDDCAHFQALDGLYSQADDFEQADAFAYRFKVGTMLMCAVLMDGNEPPLDNDN